MPESDMFGFKMQRAWGNGISLWLSAARGLYGDGVPLRFGFKEEPFTFGDILDLFNYL